MLSVPKLSRRKSDRQASSCVRGWAKWRRGCTLALHLEPLEARRLLAPFAADVILNDTFFGPNRQIIGELGTVTGGCRDPFGIPVSDFYVVPHGTAVDGANLRSLDPAGRPNTIRGFGGGGFFNQLIGITKPTMASSTTQPDKRPRSPSSRQAALP